MVKAIETRYAGCRFRSRLEARWAVFFDKIGISWEFEPEGFETPAGRYLPDFWLPEQHRWVEVKGGSFTRRDRERAEHVAEYAWQQGAGFRVLLGDIPRRCFVGPIPDRGLINALGYGHNELLPVSPEVIGEVFPEGVPDLHTWPYDRALPVRCSPGELLEWGRLRTFGSMPWAPAADIIDIDAALTAARSERFGT